MHGILCPDRRQVPRPRRQVVGATRDRDGGQASAHGSHRLCRAARAQQPPVGRLATLGLRLGDRVGTLAWNTQHHLEIYYATMGAGLVCHTLNPRLTVAHLAAIINEAEDRVLAVGVEPGAAADASCCRCVPRSSMSWSWTESCRTAARTRGMDGQIVAARSAARATRRGGRLGRLRRGGARRALLHLGHDGRAQGRALHPSLQLSAHAARAAGRRDRADRPRRGAGRRADVPRQWLGPALRRAGGGRQARAARPPCRWRQPGDADARREA